MIPLQTIVPTPKSPIRLSHDRPVMLVGSCFTSNMADRLADSGFRVMANPFGILYNPVSIAQCLSYCIDATEITDADLVFHDGLYHSLLHHGSFSNADRQQCLDHCNQVIRQAHAFLSQDPVVILTLGSAYAYRYHDSRVVANCHKLPSQEFTKQLLSVDEVVRSLAPVISGREVVFTVSPIRHWADTPHGNILGKSTLFLAIESLMRQPHPDSVVDYFPAYEILMDELRDYRFYDADMLHPSPTAVEIIWERFFEACLTPDARQLARKYQQLHRMQAHRPLFPDSEAYRQHLAKVEELQKELDNMNNNI